jgi:DegV family protein with EDD domain
MTVRIVTDSTCDLPDSTVEEYGIQVIPQYLHFGEQSYLDGVELSRQAFYLKLAESKAAVFTAAAGPHVFRNVYEELAQAGATQVLSIHVSERLSGTMGVARLAAHEATTVSVHVFDSRQLSLGTGFLVQTAAEAASEGKPLEEILAQLDEQIKRTHVFAALDTLEYLRRGGRMNGVVAGLGSILQIKPILRMYDGNPTSERVRTRGKAMERLNRILEEIAPLERAAIVHAHAAESAQELRERTRHLLPAGDIPVVEINPVIGAHVGPGTVGFACVQARSQ